MGGKVRRRWEGREGVLRWGEIRGKTLLYGEVMGRKTTKIGGKHDALCARREWGAELKGDCIGGEVHLVESPTMAGREE